MPGQNQIRNPQPWPFVIFDSDAAFLRDLHIDPQVTCADELRREVRITRAERNAWQERTCELQGRLRVARRRAGLLGAAVLALCLIAGIGWLHVLAGKGGW